MFARKHPEIQGTLLPTHWLEKASHALNERFETFSEKYQFYLYGEAHRDEITLIASAVKREIEQSPISFFLSSDLTGKESEKDYLKTLDEMLNTCECFFEEVFDDEENWSEYTSLWLETQVAKKKLYYKVTRENIYLSLEANKILEDAHE